MGNKKLNVKVLVVAMSLATAWAIRGQFGHEQGAAWAGAIGGLALVVVGKRKDWHAKMVLIALASALGWGAGGMISYGVVVGYGKADNFINAFWRIGLDVFDFFKYLFIKINWIHVSLFGEIGGGFEFVPQSVCLCFFAGSVTQLFDIAAIQISLNQEFLQLLINDHFDQFIWVGNQSFFQFIGIEFFEF